MTASYSGFVNGDTSASLTMPPTLAITATATSPVGSYPITVSGALDANYTISYVAGTLTLSQASTITGIGTNSAASVFGEPIFFAATVLAVAPGAGTPTGTVAFKRLFPDGTTVTFGTAPLDASGTAIPLSWITSCRRPRRSSPFTRGTATSCPVPRRRSRM